MTIFTSLFIAVSQLSLCSTNDYLWCTGSCPYRIIGYGCGSLTTNLVDRGEDMAFIAEAGLERHNIPISSEEYDYDVIKANNRPYPGLAEEFPNATATSPWYQWESKYRDRGLGDYGNFISCVYDESKITGSMVDCGPYVNITGVSADNDYVASNIFKSAKIDAPRSPIYWTKDTNRWQRLILRGDQAFGIYNDLHLNQGLCFHHSPFCGGGSISHSLIEREGLRDTNPSWGVISPAAYHEGPNVTESTNREDSAFIPYWSDSCTGTKYRQADYDGQELICEAKLYGVTSEENYSKSVSNTYIRFHSYLSNKVDRLKTFAAWRVRRSTYSSTGLNNVVEVEVDRIVLAPLAATRISDADDGGPRFSISLNMPSDAHNVAMFAGASFPSETFDQKFRSLEYPDIPTPTPGSSYKNTYVKQSSIDEVIMVRLLRIYGIAKIIYHARELRN